jgi:hypothetical protein
VAERLIDKAEEGDLPSISGLIDRLDGKAAQVSDQGQMTVTQLTDSQLYEIAARGLTETNLVPKAIIATTTIVLHALPISLSFAAY